MVRARAASWAPRLRSRARRRRPSSRPPGPSSTGCSTTTTSSMGTRLVPRRARRHARPHPRDRHRRLHRPDAAAGRVPGRHGGGRGAPAPAAGRRPRSSTSTTATTPRPSTTSSRSTTSIVREWGEDGKLDEADAPAGPLRQGRLHPEGRRHPAPEGEAGLAPGAERGDARAPTPTARSARLFNRFPKRELFYADAADLEARSSTASST